MQQNTRSIANMDDRKEHGAALAELDSADAAHHAHSTQEVVVV